MLRIHHEVVFKRILRFIASGVLIKQPRHNCSQKLFPLRRVNHMNNLWVIKSNGKIRFRSLDLSVQRVTEELIAEWATKCSGKFGCFLYVKTHFSFPSATYEWHRTCLRYKVTAINILVILSFPCDCFSIKCWNASEIRCCLKYLCTSWQILILKRRKFTIKTRWK